MTGQSICLKLYPLFQKGSVMTNGYGHKKEKKKKPADQKGKGHERKESEKRVQTGNR